MGQLSVANSVAVRVLAGQVNTVSVQHSFRGTWGIAQTPRERPLVSASFLIVDPNYYQAAALQKVLRVLLSHESYVPERISGGQDKVETRRFSSDSVEPLAEMWERTNRPIGWDLERRVPPCGGRHHEGLRHFRTLDNAC